jgi:membrane protease YdiL (CAAX protease family)
MCCLLLWHNVFAVFAVYHLGFCLLLPALRNLLLRKGSWQAHLESLGLTGPGTRRGLLLGLGLGTVLAAGTLLAFRLFGDKFLAAQNVPEVLAGWGVIRTNLAIMFWFMTLANGPAEELYWRGFVHTELVGCRPRWWAILLPAACYASYHGVTVYLLVANLPVALLFMTAILAAGVFWGWLREKTGSVWPALLSHAGATAAYMIVARPLLDF